MYEHIINEKTTLGGGGGGGVEGFGYFGNFLCVLVIFLPSYGNWL